MPDPQLVDQLVRAGGWALFLTTVIVIAITGVRGDWVFGWIYRRSEERNERIEKAIAGILDWIAPRKGPGA